MKIYLQLRINKVKIELLWLEQLTTGFEALLNLSLKTRILTNLVNVAQRTDQQGLVLPKM